MPPLCFWFFALFYHFICLIVTVIRSLTVAHYTYHLMAWLKAISNFDDCTSVLFPVSHHFYVSDSPSGGLKCNNRPY